MGEGMRSFLLDPYGGTCLVGDGGGRRLGWRVNNSVQKRGARTEEQKDPLNRLPYADDCSI